MFKSVLYLISCIATPFAILYYLFNSSSIGDPISNLMSAINISEENQPYSLIFILSLPSLFLALLGIFTLLRTKDKKLKIIIGSGVLVVSIITVGLWIFVFSLLSDS